ncbi:MAG: multicopper oxidase family protein [Myxococcota bacterium]
MMILMLLLFWACQDPPPNNEPPLTDSAQPDDPHQDTANTDEEPPRAPIPLPPLTDAPDLDPDEDVVQVELTAAPKTHRFVDVDGTEHVVEGYAYNGLTPGPTIRAKVGDQVIIDVDNNLDQPTTIHWHGVGVPFEMDGVAWMGAPIAAGASFQYAFTVQRPGTFWYHPHFNTNRQVSGGLYGVLIVTDPEEPAPDLDQILVFDDWHFEGLDDHDHLAAEGTWTVNGQIQPFWDLDGGQIVRARVLNASNLGYLDLRLPEIRLLGGDQGLNARLTAPDNVLMAPGDRIELEVRPAQTDFEWINAPYVHQGGAAWGPEASLMRVHVDAPDDAAPGLSWPFSGLRSTEDPGRTDITYVFSGSNESGVWMLNGEVFPDVTIEELSLGDEAILEIRNLSPTEHPFHMHGTRIEILSVNGIAETHQRWEDTINVPTYGTVRVRMIADNPGDWMTHCHILPHADGGMMTVLRVHESPEGE